MDSVYRVYGKGEAAGSGSVVTGLKTKSIITQPLADESLPAGTVVILGAAYGGETDIVRVDVSTDGGASWSVAEFIGPHEPFAWRLWQYCWQVDLKGEYTILSRATDDTGRQQPMKASWNVLGYGNNGVREHAVQVKIV